VATSAGEGGATGDAGLAVATVREPNFRDKQASGGGFRGGRFPAISSRWPHCRGRTRENTYAGSGTMRKNDSAKPVADSSLLALRDPPPISTLPEVADASLLPSCAE